MKIERLMDNLNPRFTSRNHKPRVLNEIESSIRGDMSDLNNNALKIANHLYRHNFVGSRSVKASELRNAIDALDEDFDSADEYLLQAGICNGHNGRRRR
jgi:superoxide dismutase